MQGPDEGVYPNLSFLLGLRDQYVASLEQSQDERESPLTFDHVSLGNEYRWFGTHFNNFLLATLSNHKVTILRKLHISHVVLFNVANVF